MSRRPLVLHSSLVRLGVQAATPLFLLALGLAGLRGGGGVVPVVLTAFGVGTALVVLLDLPVRSEFTEEGIVRVCALRQQHLPWSRVVAVERVGGLGGMPRRSGDVGAERSPGRMRGLAARTGPRRVHLLVDRRESHAEWDALRSLLKDRATQLRAKEPPLEAPPAGRGARALHRRDEAP